MANVTRIAGAAFGMALFTLAHLHGVGTIPGQTVLEDDRELFILGNIAVAAGTLDVRFDMSSMREIDVIGLASIDQPRDFLVFLQILLDQDFLGLAAAHRFFMALTTVLGIGNPGIGAIATKSMAVHTFAIGMGRVAKAKGLSLL